MENKRGSEKYYILMSLILGLLVLGISLYFIFHEYFTEDEIDWEKCRQSIYLRQLMPESSGPLSAEIEELKDMIPLKCKTEVVDLGVSDTGGDREVADDAMKDLADKMVQCFKLFGEGKYKLFPVNFMEESKDCSICFRVRFDDEFEDEGFKFDFDDYLFTHNLDGDEVGRDDENRISYGEYLTVFSSGSDKLVFRDDGNWAGGYGQGSGSIDPAGGDLLIGMYFYSNRNYLEDIGVGPSGINLNLLTVSRYQQSYPFYTQVGDPALSDCDIRSIPA